VTATTDVFEVIGGCEFGGDCSCQKAPPAGLEAVVSCEKGQWVLISGIDVETNQTIFIPQNTTVVRLPCFVTECASLLRHVPVVTYRCPLRVSESILSPEKVMICLSFFFFSMSRVRFSFSARRGGACN
jgi:hypothetical protein